MGLPVWRSHSSVVSRWLVMPMAAMLAAVSLAFFSAALAVASWVFQMVLASCSTQPGLRKICGNSFCATAFTRPARSKTIARELVVPWSSARMYFIFYLTQIFTMFRIYFYHEYREHPCSKLVSNPEHLVDPSAEDAADARADDGNPRVAPIRAALAVDGQQRVGDARAEVARGIDGVAGGAAEGKAN